jgi:hypothetical protein
MDFTVFAIVAIIGISGVWVFWDARKNKIGKFPGKASLLNISSGALGGATLLLWIVTFPLYLIKRSSLIERAKETPASPSGNVAFAVCAVIFALVSAVNLSSTSLPGCDSQEVADIANQVISESPIVKLAGLNIGKIENPAEQSYANGKRICRGFVKNPLGANVPINFSVSWHDKSKGLIYVEFIE